MLSGTGGNLNARAIVGSGLALKYSGNLTELAAHFFNHLLGSTAHGLHCKTAEQEGSHGTDECTHQHLRVHQVHLEVVHEVGDGGLGGTDHLALHVGHHHVGTIHGNLDFLDIRGQKCQSGKCGRTDGEALTRSGRGVAKCIQGIGAVAHFLTQLAHLGVTTGIVGNRTVGVGGQCDTQCGEHTHGSDTHAIKSVGQALRRHREVESVGTHIAHQDGHANGDDGNAG